MLTGYRAIFSTEDGNVEGTTLVEHSIPLEEGTRPNRQQPHRLGPEKEAKAERQVQELLQKKTDRAGRKCLKLSGCPCEKEK